MKLSEGTLVDATLITAPPSTKNQDQSRDPEMHQSKKSNLWYFGIKVHTGADSHSGLVHSDSVTAATVHDSQGLLNLLHGQETRLYGDSAYRGKKQRARLKQSAPKAKDFTNKPAHRPARSAMPSSKPIVLRLRCALRPSSIPDAQAHLGLRQGSLSRFGEERQRAYAILAW